MAFCYLDYVFYETEKKFEWVSAIKEYKTAQSVFIKEQNSCNSIEEKFLEPFFRIFEYAKENGYSNFQVYHTFDFDLLSKTDNFSCLQKKIIELDKYSLFISLESTKFKHNLPQFIQELKLECEEKLKQPNLSKYENIHQNLAQIIELKKEQEKLFKEYVHLLHIVEESKFTVPDSYRFYKQIKKVMLEKDELEERIALIEQFGSLSNMTKSLKGMVEVHPHVG